ncbi:hypothetical protein IMZ31_22460 (plasmid) [Pontibacillus sp. ALD_SL1]|uniref:hypothetical protein n=1 Tax=Pontibacillus sp. ALD_SL1 TaxID=2777185 RepID=UPI001A962BAD|nr:hypothetical protein [Pontibacillus sp. ALD_SL1]QST02219.1 hypothetical protein IMZ31_22460 [Pontibacillus sp. ALD_SL1]
MEKLKLTPKLERILKILTISIIFPFIAFLLYLVQLLFATPLYKLAGLEAAPFDIPLYQYIHVTTSIFVVVKNRFLLISIIDEAIKEERAKEEDGDKEKSE